MKQRVFLNSFVGIMSSCTCFIFCLLFTIASCTQSSNVSTQDMIPVRLMIRGLEITQDRYDESRATASEVGLTYVTFAAFDANNNKVAESVKSNLEDGFGTFECSLHNSHYQIVAVAHKGTLSAGCATIISPTQVNLPTVSISETFSGVVDVDLSTATTNQTKDVNIKVHRVTSALKLISISPQPDDVTQMRVTIGDITKEAYSSLYFNPLTGFMANFGTTGFYSKTKNISSTSRQTTSYLFDLLVPSEGEKMRVMIETLDGEGKTIDMHVLEDVPFDTNRMTVATGSLFGDEWKGLLNIDASWKEEYEVSF